MASIIAPRLAIVTAVVVLGSACCSCAIQPYAGSAKPRLQFVGDSITFQAAQDIDRHFGADYDVAITAVSGVDTFFMADGVAAARLHAPAVVVINLGTNDARTIGVPYYSPGPNGTKVLRRPPQSVADVEARLDHFAAEFTPATCVVFVTVDSHNPSWGATYAAKINTHLRAVDRHIVDWDAARRPRYFDRADDPHPNEAGRQALLTLEDAAIASCP